MDGAQAALQGLIEEAPDLHRPEDGVDGVLTFGLAAIGLAAEVNACRGVFRCSRFEVIENELEGDATEFTQVVGQLLFKLAGGDWGRRLLAELMDQVAEFADLGHQLLEQFFRQFCDCVDETVANTVLHRGILSRLNGFAEYPNSAGKAPISAIPNGESCGSDRDRVPFFPRNPGIGRW